MKLLIDKLSNEQRKECKVDKTMIGIKLKSIKEVTILIIIIYFYIAEKILVNVHCIVPIPAIRPIFKIDSDVTRKFLSDH